MSEWTLPSKVKVKVDESRSRVEIQLPEQSNWIMLSNCREHAEALAVCLAVVIKPSMGGIR